MKGTRSRKRKRGDYILQLSVGKSIDGSGLLTFGSVINKSNDPNVQFQKWTVDGEERLAIYALRDIRRGQFLSVDNNFSVQDASNSSFYGNNNEKKRKFSKKESDVIVDVDVLPENICKKTSECFYFKYRGVDFTSSKDLAKVLSHRKFIMDLIEEEQKRTGTVISKRRLIALKDKYRPGD